MIQTARSKDRYDNHVYREGHTDNLARPPVFTIDPKGSTGKDLSWRSAQRRPPPRRGPP